MKEPCIKFKSSIIKRGPDVALQNRVAVIECRIDDFDGASTFSSEEGFGY